MSFIEGIGDEVTAFFVVVIVIALASFITFIGNENNFNSFTPIHTRVNAAQQEQVSSQQNSTTQDTTSENTATNLSPSLNTDNVGPWPPDDNRFYQGISNDNHPTDDISDDTEEQSSSDEGRLYPEPSEVESPTAPPIVEQEEHVRVQAQTEEPLAPNQIRVRLKYLDDTERTVRCNRNVQIGDFKRNHFPDELASNKQVRLIFCGHLLRDASTLDSYRVLDNSVVHVQVLQAQAATSRTNQGSPPNTDLDLSYLLWPLVILILCSCWCVYFKHPEFFNMLSLGLLLLFSGSFVIFYSTSLRR